MFLQRHSKRLLAAALVIVLIYVASRLVVFAELFGIFKEHSGIKITQTEIALAHNTTVPDPRTAVVPKILHQIFHSWEVPINNTLPSHWEEARQTCITLNPDWEHKVSSSYRCAASPRVARYFGIFYNGMLTLFI